MMSPTRTSGKSSNKVDGAEASFLTDVLHATGNGICRLLYHLAVVKAAIGTAGGHIFVVPEKPFGNLTDFDACGKTLLGGIVNDGFFQLENAKPESLIAESELVYRDFDSPRAIQPLYSFKFCQPQSQEFISFSKSNCYTFTINGFDCSFTKLGMTKTLANTEITFHFFWFLLLGIVGAFIYGIIPIDVCLDETCMGKR